jgi:hypothetical protein
MNNYYLKPWEKLKTFLKLIKLKEKSLKTK